MAVGAQTVEPGRALRWTWALPIALAVLPWFLLHAYVSGDAIQYAYDYAQLQCPRFVILRRAIVDDGQFPLWQTLVYAGSPFHANPENPSLYPPVLLAVRALPVVAAMNGLILLHLSAAAVGMYVLVRRLAGGAGIDRAPAAAGAFLAALLFGLGFFTRIEHFNFVVYGFAHALIPWILVAADALLRGPAPRRAAALLACLLAAQVFTGGLYVIVYTALALAAWLAALGLLGDRERRRRAWIYGGLAAALALVLVLPKAIPFLSWISTTNRAAPLEPEEAVGMTLAGHREFHWEKVGDYLLQFFGSYWLAAGLALIPLVCWRALRHRAAATSLFLVLLGFTLALGPAYRELARLVPPFDRIQNALRAWTLVNAFLPVVVGLAVADALARARLSARSRAAAPLLACVAALAIVPVLLRSGRHDPLLENPDSYVEVLSRYRRWPEVRDLARAEWRAMNADVPALGERNEQFVTAPLGVETVNGYFGYAYPRALQRFAYGEPGRRLEPERRRRRLGALSVRYLVEGAPDDDARGILPRGIEGERIVENPHARPRAFVPRAVVGVIGRDDGTVVETLFDAPGFDPTAVSVVSFAAGRPPSDEMRAALDAVVAVGDEPAPANAVRVAWPLGDDARGALEGVASRASSLASTRPASAATFERVGAEGARVRRADGAKGAFVVMSETWSLYGGWRARAGARDAEIQSADAVASAVFLRAGETEVSARYDPPEVRLGFRLGFAGLVAAAILIAPWPKRRLRSGP